MATSATSERENKERGILLMYTDDNLQEIVTNQSQPLANRLLAELIIEQRRNRSMLTLIHEEQKQKQDLHGMLEKLLNNPQRSTGYLKDKSEKKQGRK